MKKKSRSTAATESPVTLAEARAMVESKPARRRAPAAITTATTATPEAVGAERKKRLRQRRLEQDRRSRDYKSVMAIMKKWGVKGLPLEASPPPKRRGTGPARAPKTSAPLQVLAEGDSWFDYPVPFFGGGIIPRLETRLGVPILNMADAGDEVRFMLGVEQRIKMAKRLQNGCPTGGPWDLMLFSGGGNDIVDNPMALWIRDFKRSTSPAKLIHQKRFDAALALVQAGYEDLISLRDSLSPSTHLVFHAYDYAIPDGRGVCRLGPWLKPTFDVRKFPIDSTARFKVVKVMLTQFASLLVTLEKEHRGVTFINGQGTLPQDKSSWHNELHPSKRGFNRFATVFHQQIKVLFPNRVL